MVISPITALVQNASNSVNFNGFQSVYDDQRKDAVLNNRKVAMIGAACLTGAIGLLSAGLTSCITNSRAKITSIGILSGLAVGYLSWPKESKFDIEA